MRSEVIFFVNGIERRVVGRDAFLNLSTWLREVQHQVGTKVVCEEGDCGACTVLIGRPVEGKLNYLPVNSCIQSVAQLDCAHVVTVEGLAREGALSLMQEAMVEHHGAQCGYCTPGFVVAMTALAEERRKWDEQDVRDALTGNLCRCTGYEPIIKAAMAASNKAAPRMEDLYQASPIVSTIERESRNSLAVESNGRRYFAPATLDEALRIKADHGNVIIVQGGTDIGVVANKRAFIPPVLLNLAHVRELAEMSSGESELVVGSTVTLSRLEREVEKSVPELHRILRLFGSPQIRNAGTLAGNIANGSPIADTLPFLFVAGASIEVASIRGRRQIEINSLYKGYKTLDIAPDELITKIVIPIPPKNETLRLYKVSKRKDLDISAFTAALRLTIREQRMSAVRIAFGGVGPTVMRLPETEAFLDGRELSEETFVAAGEIARGEITPITDVRGSADFRFQLAENIFLKFFHDVRQS